MDKNLTDPARPTCIDPAPDVPITHPEEMRAAFDLRIGNNISLRGTGRMTPAGVATIGIAISLIVAAFGFLAWANRESS